jgi:glycerol-3-phosphate dehydrogenase
MHAMNRPSKIELEYTTFDVAIVGGGMIGAAIARDAVMRRH